MITTRPIVRLLLVSIATIGLALQTATRANCQIPADSVTAGKWTAVTFDAAQTTIAYRLIGWPHVTNGMFKLKSGVIRVNASSGKIAGEIVVDAASGDSGHSVRDARMKDSILEANRYPEITFAPQQVESHGVPRGEFPVVVRGVMTLHGKAHPFTVTAIAHISDARPTALLRGEGFLARDDAAAQRIGSEFP